MIDIKTKKSELCFPMDIFSPDVQQSFTELAEQYSIPLDYLGTTAIWLIAALSGNMYEVEKMKVKPIVYCLLLGPSSLGKSVAHRILCDDIIAKKEAHNVADFQRRLLAWKEVEEEAKRDKTGNIKRLPFPIRKIRTATNATTEAIIQYATTNPAGFGMYFDEGMAMYSGGAYKKENNSVDFWNKAWNGDAFNELRVDNTRERYVEAPAISVLAGMQTERIAEMFSKDTVDSGLINRFLFTASNYVHLNDNIDHFADRMVACEEWQNVVTRLFNKGMSYIAEDLNDPFSRKAIPFRPDARLYFNNTANLITREANELIRDLREGDGQKNIIAYWGKLFQYFKRFLPLLAILRDPDHPIIDTKVVEDARKLYYYYRNQAKMILHSLISEQETSLNENELKLFNMLPDTFQGAEAIEIAEALKFSHGYFHNVYRRKYSKGFIRKSADGYYKV
jgi:Protein of unknown function (DUF3987)